MAKSKNKTDDSHERIARKILEQITEKLPEAMDSIISNAANRNSARFTIMGKINDPDGIPECFTDIRWAKRFSLKSESVLEDPNQPDLLLKNEDPD